MEHIVDSNDNAPSCTSSNVTVEVISHDDGNANQEYRRTSMTSNINLNRLENRNSIISKKSNTLDNERYDRDLDTIELMPMDKCDLKLIMNDSTTRIHSQSTFDHFYKEIPSKLSVKKKEDHDILDYYEKYNTKAAKTLIDTLFLPSQKICRQCAQSIKNSMVYSDRLIYEKQPLYARKIVFYYVGFDTHQMFFEYDDNCPMNQSFVPSVDQDFMPVINVIKTNKPGLLYPSKDKRHSSNSNEILPPNTLLINIKMDDIKLSTEIYRRIISNMECRVSRLRVCRPMIFYNIHCNNSDVNMKQDSNCDDNLQSWMDYNDETQLFRSKHHNELALSATRMHQHRSSLLMLEPLLIMPDFPTSRSGLAKNRITHSEHVKIVRMVIAYTLSFFLLAIVTFYIVYFA